MNVTRLIQRTLHSSMTLAACATSMLAMTACTAIMDGESLEDCPTGDFTVQFVYDYNIQRADMFRDHVGEVKLYVFDAVGNCVAQRNVNDRAAISNKNKRFNITLRAANQPGVAELVAGESYRFVAIAGQKAGAIVPTLDELPHLVGADEHTPYRYAQLDRGGKLADLRVGLDRLATPDNQGRYAVGHNMPLDTLWHTLGALPKGIDNTNISGWTTDTLITIRPNIVDSINVVKPQPEDTLTLSLIRDTKHLHISLNELDAPGIVDLDDYEIYIEDANGRMDWQNNMTPDNNLIYRPYAQRSEDMTDAGVPGISGQWDMMFNRIIYHDNPMDDARLYVIRKSDKMTVADVSLPRILTYDRMAQHYYQLTNQGYLDREYDYNLKLFLRGGKWKETEIRLYVNGEVNILSWARREQDSNLGEKDAR